MAPFGATGRFLLVAGSRVRRPDLERRLIAVTPAEQIGVQGGETARRQPSKR